MMLKLLPSLFPAILVSAALQAAGAPFLGTPPEAPTPEEVARLPRRGLGKHGPTGPFAVNTASREEVRNFFNTVYAASEGFSVGWSGDLATCSPGTTDPGFRDLVATRINFFRAMAGVPAGIVFDDTNNRKDQDAALIMAANGALSHFPPPSWTCYTADGADAADSSNLALGNAGPDAITAYMEDFGGNNAPVGHRRWIIYPQTQIMGTGDLPDTAGASAANATWVFDGHYSDPRPSTRTNFVSWPPPGYVPYPIVYARWSFSYPNATFTSQTSVTLSSNGVDVAVTKEDPQDGAGENTLVWYPSALDPARPYAWPRPAADTVFMVRLQNVSISGSPRDFSYTVTVIDPQVPGPDTVVPVVTGPDQPAVNESNNYTLTAVPGATGYQWRSARRTAFTAVEGAEKGLADFATNTSPDYSVVVSSPRASGAAGFHLAHPPPPTDQILTYKRALLPAARAQLRFQSRLGLASPNQVARVEISRDQGSSWQALYSQAGVSPDGGNGESTFNSRTISLDAFAGRSVLVRFRYHYPGSGTYYPQTDSPVGWFFDDIAFTNTEETTDANVTDLASGNTFSFAPPQVGDFALDARAEVYDQFHLEWGPVKRVSATTALPPMTVEFAGVPGVSGNEFQVEFTVVNYRAGTVFELQKAGDPAGVWNPDAGALFKTVTPDTRFRVTTSAAGVGRAFYRLMAN